ncbi:unannotated protein [freshwater metagenome]|uniref:Unannotated protein n=1 Tax=freshwater metagenome TaxID=449393 RepID=A0A6J6U214_9ZZZZ|nr:AAA family ATPase [Actinomycetota bacterium]
MRFSKLHLAKFGMFTDTVLDVSLVGVNVIVGKNEAGKSTAMDAITQLLYGIPLQSVHDYVHKYPDLRIGGALVGSDGKSIEIYRIKKNGPSLRSACGDTIGDEVLRELLGGVNEDVFTQLFSISHDEITEGGAALLDSEGELGAALFGAGTGLTTLNAVLAKLDSRAGELFKPSASKPLVNADLARYRDLTARVKETSQSAVEVERLNKTMRTAEGNQTAKDAELKNVSSALSRTTRVRRSKVLVFKRRDAIDELAGLELQGSRVDAQIPALLTAASDVRFQSTTATAGLEADLAALNRKLDELVVDEQLLAQSSNINALTEEIGTLRVNYKDLPGLNKQVGDLERALAGLVRRLPEGCRRDTTDMPQLTDVEISSVRRLVTSRDRLEPALETAHVARTESERLLASDEANFSALREPANVVNLAAAVARIRQEGQLEAGIATLRAEADGLVATISATLASIGLRSAPRDADAMPIPDGASVHDADSAVTVARNDLVTAANELDRLRSERATADDELQSLIRRADPPSSAELETERSRRDDGWQLVRAAWLGPTTASEGVEAWTAGEALDVAYEASVASADSVADRLLGDAQSVEKRALLERLITGSAESILAQEGIVAERHKGLDAATERWDALWARLSIEAGDRKAMDNLLTKANTAAASAARLRGLDERLAAQQTIVEASRSDLRSLLAEAGDTPDEQLTLAALLDRAESHCAQAGRDREARTIAEKAVAAASKAVNGTAGKLEGIEKELAEWLTEWTEALVPLGLSADTKASDVSDLLDTIADVDMKSADLDEKRRRVAGIERRNNEILDDLAAVRARLSHLGLGDDAATSVISGLKERLDAAVKIRTQRGTLEKERDEKVTAMDSTRGTLVRAETDIRQLVEQSNLADEDALRSAVTRTERATELESLVAQWDDELLEAAGVPVEQVESEVDELVDADLDALIDELSGQRDALDEERTEITLSVGALRNQLAEIDESHEAALAAEKAQATLAELSDHADEYIRVVLAKQILEREIEAYRERNQGPILGKASELFERLTLHRYTGIETDTDRKGKVVLQAKTANGSLIEVSRLSTGTRDQLYLALRLAALEHFAAAGQSVPLLLDDLFVHFDDERTQAGLRVLDELSSTVQVLLFTHHERVAEQAMKAIDAPRLTVLQLGTHV